MASAGHGLQPGIASRSWEIRVDLRDQKRPSKECVQNACHSSVESLCAISPGGFGRRRRASQAETRKSALFRRAADGGLGFAAKRGDLRTASVTETYRRWSRGSFQWGATSAATLDFRRPIVPMGFASFSVEAGTGSTKHPGGHRSYEGRCIVQIHCTRMAAAVGD